MNNHQQGVSVEAFANSALAGFFDLLSTSVDRAGRRFVSTIEAKGGAPIWGVQWHPEKNAFEEGLAPDGSPYEVTNHSAPAVRATWQLAQTFLSAARRSSHTFRDAQLERNALFGNTHTHTHTHTHTPRLDDTRSL